MWDSIVVTDTPSSLADHEGLLEVLAHNECYVPSAGYGSTFLCQAAWDILVLRGLCRHVRSPTDLVTRAPECP